LLRQELASCLTLALLLVLPTTARADGLTYVSQLKGNRTAKLPTFGSQWQIVGAGDVDRDGITDLLWNDTTTGAFAYWYMQPLGADGTQAVRATSPMIDATGSAVKRKSDLLARRQHLSAGERLWQPVALVDWNRDGVQDVVWQSESKQPFLYEVWLMSDTATTAGSQVKQVLPVEVSDLPDSTEDSPFWGARDFDGDGAIDLVSTRYPGAIVGVRGTLACEKLAAPNALHSFDGSLGGFSRQRAGTGDLDFDGIPELLQYDGTFIIGIEPSLQCSGVASFAEARRIQVWPPFEVGSHGYILTSR